MYRVWQYKRGFNRQIFVYDGYMRLHVHQTQGKVNANDSKLAYYNLHEHATFLRTAIICIYSLATPRSHSFAYRVHAAVGKIQVL